MVISIDILELIDQLEALVSGGMRVPFSVKTAIDENAFFDLIDQLRVAIPQEIKQANDLLQQKEKVLTAASEEADRIITEAQERATRLLDGHEIIAAAQAQAETIRAQSQREAEAIRKGADDYALGTLSDLESRLGSLLRTTSNGLAALKRRQTPVTSETPDETA